MEKSLKRTELYPAQVFWSDEDDAFVATAPDLPGCSAIGNTRQDALSELNHAIEAWIQAAERAGNPIPSPSHPAEEVNYSGKLLLRMPKDLHKKLAISAAKEGTSLNNLIVYLLTWKHVEHQSYTATPADIVLIGQWGDQTRLTSKFNVSHSRIYVRKTGSFKPLPADLAYGR